MEKDPCCSLLPPCFWSFCLFLLFVSSHDFQFPSVSVVITAVCRGLSPHISHRCTFSTSEDVARHVQLCSLHLFFFYLRPWHTNASYLYSSATIFSVSLFLHCYVSLPAAHANTGFFIRFQNWLWAFFNSASLNFQPRIFLFSLSVALSLSLSALVLLVYRYRLCEVGHLLCALTLSSRVASSALLTRAQVWPHLQLMPLALWGNPE